MLMHPIRGIYGLLEANLPSLHGESCPHIPPRHVVRDHRNSRSPPHLRDLATRRTLHRHTAPLPHPGPLQAPRVCRHARPRQPPAHSAIHPSGAGRRRHQKRLRLSPQRNRSCVGARLHRLFDCQTARPRTRSRLPPPTPCPRPPHLYGRTLPPLLRLSPTCVHHGNRLTSCPSDPCVSRKITPSSAPATAPSLSRLAS